MRDIAAWVADLGYIAVCPDLFWRIEPGIDITDKSDAEWKRAFELFSKFDQVKGIEDLKATVAAGRDLARCERQGRDDGLLPGRPARVHDGGAVGCGRRTFRIMALAWTVCWATSTR